MRNPGDLQTHLYAGQSSGQHEIVKIAQVSDAENSVLDFSEPGAEWHVELLENGLAKLVGRVTGGRIDGRQRAAILLRIESHDFQTPGAHGTPCRLAMPRVPRNDILQ